MSQNVTKKVVTGTNYVMFYVLDSARNDSDIHEAQIFKIRGFRSTLKVKSEAY